MSLVDLLRFDRIPTIRAKKDWVLRVRGIICPKDYRYELETIDAKMYRSVWNKL